MRRSPGRTSRARTPAWRRRWLALALSLAGGLGPAAWPAPGGAAAADLVRVGDLVDAVLAEVEREVVTASDVALARALGLFGLAPSPAPISAADVERLVDARLLLAEARRLGLGPEAAETEAAWAAASARAGGEARLAAWLARTGIDPGWARRLVGDDVAWRAYVDARFRAFVFVPEQDVTAALGPGPHTATARERQRDVLRARETERRLAQWQRDARARTAVRLLLAPGATVPCPLPMPGASPGTGRRVLEDRREPALYRAPAPDPSQDVWNPRNRPGMRWISCTRSGGISWRIP
jgi:hypothetical protein